MPKAVFYGQLCSGKCNRGAPRKRLKDQLKRQLALAGIDHKIWEQDAADRDGWRSDIKKASHRFEVDRHEAAEECMFYGCMGFIDSNW